MKRPRGSSWRRVRSAGPVLLLSATCGFSNGDHRGVEGVPIFRPPLVAGLDHVPIAVIDLDAAAGRYRRLGFVLKPGLPHENGIRNLHAKFPDGTELELITAPEARDPLTSEYRRFLADGDGPAFLGLYAPERDRLARRLDAVGRPNRLSGGILSLEVADSLRYVFFGGRNASPTDRPEHFAHPNTALSLTAVWLAGKDFTPERALLSDVGVLVVDREHRLPAPARGSVARIGEGEIRFLPEAATRIKGRRIVGATVRVRSIEETRRVLKRGLSSVPAIEAGESGSSILIPPEETRGLWLEFWEPPPEKG